MNDQREMKLWVVWGLLEKMMRKRVGNILIVLVIKFKIICQQKYGPPFFAYIRGIDLSRQNENIVLVNWEQVGL
jgi:hypothetical protein